MNCSIPVKEEVKESMSEPEVAEISEAYKELGEKVIREHPELDFIHQYNVEIGYMGWQLKGLLARKQAEAQSIKGGAFVNELFDSGAGEEDEETETYEAEE